MRPYSLQRLRLGGISPYLWRGTGSSNEIIIELLHPSPAVSLADPVVRSAVWITTRENVFKQALVRQASIQGGQRILDLGCGTGTLAMMVKHMQPDVEVVGLDANPEALKLARAKLELAGLEVQLDHGLASALPYSADRFDKVISSLFFITYLLRRSRK